MVRLAQEGYMTALGTYECLKCGEAHLTASRRWHDEESRWADVERMARGSGMSVEEVDRRLRLLDRIFEPEKANNVSEQPENEQGISEQVFCLLHTDKEVPWDGVGRRPKWCSDACRMAFNRKKAKS